MTVKEEIVDNLDEAPVTKEATVKTETVGKSIADVPSLVLLTKIMMLHSGVRQTFLLMTRRTKMLLWLGGLRPLIVNFGILHFSLC